LVQRKNENWKKKRRNKCPVWLVLVRPRNWTWALIKISLQRLSKNPKSMILMFVSYWFY
jgi:hypothetical protein